MSVTNLTNTHCYIWVDFQTTRGAFDIEGVFKIYSHTNKFIRICLGYDVMMGALVNSSNKIVFVLEDGTYSGGYDNSTNIELDIYGGEDVENTNLIEWIETYGLILKQEPEEPEEPTTPTKKFTRLFLGAIAHTSNGKRFRKLQDTEYIEQTYTLSGKWVFNDTITQYMFDGYGRTWGNTQGFVSNGDTYTRIVTHPRGYISGDIDYDQISYQKDNYGNGEVFVQKSTTGWVNDNYKTIEFNGTWVVDKEFYDWFTANTTEYVEPSLPVWNGTDLTGTSWEIPSGWEAEAGYGIFNISANSDKLFITGEGFAIGYAFYTDMGDFGFTPQANAIGSGWNSPITNGEEFTLSNITGTGATNTKLIDWLKQYGTLTSHTMA